MKEEKSRMIAGSITNQRILARLVSRRNVKRALYALTADCVKPRTEYFFQTKWTTIHSAEGVPQLVSFMVINGKSRIRSVAHLGV